jgi:TPR repeat protein
MKIRDTAAVTIVALASMIVAPLAYPNYPESIKAYLVGNRELLLREVSQFTKNRDPVGAEKWLRELYKDVQEGNYFLRLPESERLEILRTLGTGLDGASIESMKMMSEIYTHFNGVRQPAEALVWKRKAADKGDTESMFQIAILLAASNNAESAKWLTRSAKGAYLPAQLVLARALLGKPKLREGEFEWVGKFVINDELTEVQRNIDRDDHLAFDWYSKAYLQLKQSCSSGAPYQGSVSECNRMLSQVGARLGWLYLDGIGTKANPLKAKEQFEIAWKDYYIGAGNGTPEAAFGLAKIYGKGLGVTKDERLSVEWQGRASSLLNKAAK